LKTLADAAVDQQRFVGSFDGRLRDSGRSFGARGAGLCVESRFGRGGVAARESSLAELEGEIYFRGAGADLHFLAGVIEAEHVDFDDPRARRHFVELEGSAGIGEREQDAVALSGFDRGSGDGLPFGLNYAGLGQNRRRETRAGDQKIS
jgi:hypothetical protein